VVDATKKRRLEERNKRALFANVGDLKTLSKQQYREFRGQKFYTMPDKGIANKAHYLGTLWGPLGRPKHRCSQNAR
jgi:hypothetical protein